jgi:hypothetical protein
MRKIQILATAVMGALFFFASMTENVKACNASGSDDICIAIQEVIPMAANGFQDIINGLDNEQTEIRGEEVFSLSVLPGFERGYRLPEFSTGKIQAQFWAGYESIEDAQAALNAIVDELKACLNVSAGYKNREDNGTHFFTSQKVTVEILTETQLDASENETYFLLLQIRAN